MSADTGKTVFSGRAARRAVLVCLSVFLLLLLSPGKAQAQCPTVTLPQCDTCCALVCAEHEITRAQIRIEHAHLRDEVLGESAGILPFWEVPEPPPGFFRLQHHERWLIIPLFVDYILPALMMMTEQLVTVMMQQMFIVGTFFDADQQMDTQLLFQKLEARAHKDYHPSFAMCEFGSVTRSLPAANFIGDLSLIALNKRFLDRQLGNNFSVGAFTPEQDRASADLSVSPTPFNRLGYFVQNTCDRFDVNKVESNPATGLFWCPGGPSTNRWVNRDIDWNNTVLSPRTINVDFTRDASDNSRLFEMSNYLYGHRVFSRPDGTLLERQQNQENFLDSRAVIAKRSVAQNSFDSIIALKTRGTRRDDPGERPMSSEDTSALMHFFMVELGFPIDDFPVYHRYMFHKHEDFSESLMDLEFDQISYYGQMEMLAKRIYQRPEFYTQLYDKPANVKRMSAAMQAVKTMLNRDIFESQLRSEMIMSMILELKITEEQANIESKLGLLRERVR